MRPPRRVTLAAVLIGIAVLLPTGAWYITGSRDAERRAASIVSSAENEARSELEREATRLGTRLDDLRRQESRRPFFHYQTLYRDPRGAAQGLAVTPSPLATGTTDPLIWAHFQIDENGLVTLPTVSERFPELSSDADFAAFCSLLAELQNAVMLETSSGSSDADEGRVLTLTEKEWLQIRSAESVYATITGRQGPQQQRSETAGDREHHIAIRVGPLNWHTMVLGSGPTLAALREVHTPAGVVLQGFAIASRVAQERLDAGPLAPRFAPAPASSSEPATALVDDTGWLLETDIGRALGPARTEAAAIKREFRINFLMTSSAIVLAAFAVLWIVIQTDRLARQRAQFAAAAAHELRTPLSGLMLHSDMLADGLGDPEHRRQYAATISSEAERLGRVVRNMLDLSRLERGVELARPMPGDLGEAVERLVARVRPRLEGEGVDVKLEIDPDLPRARFDGDALCQILDNLLDNAEKHTRSVPSRRVQVTVQNASDVVEVAVSDSGPGISRHQQRRIFRAFSRRRKDAGTPGLGLGLALARSLARAQGGDLLVRSTTGAGATFVLTLPAADTPG